MPLLLCACGCGGGGAGVGSTGTTTSSIFGAILGGSGCGGSDDWCAAIVGSDGGLVSGMTRMSGPSLSVLCRRSTLGDTAASCGAGSCGGAIIRTVITTATNTATMGARYGRRLIEDRIGLQMDKLFCKRLDLVRISGAPPKFDSEIVTFRPPQLSERIPERR